MMRSLSGLLGRHRQDDPFVAIPEILEFFLPCYSSIRYVGLQDSRRRAITEQGDWHDHIHDVAFVDCMLSSLTWSWPPQMTPEVARRWKPDMDVAYNLRKIDVELSSSHFFIRRRGCYHYYLISISDPIRSIDHAITCLEDLCLLACCWPKT